MNKQKQAFTLVELIVVITILAILWTIAFISLQWYSRDSRDSVRISDMSSIKTTLELFHLWAGKYPITTDGTPVLYSWTEAWTQGSFWESTVTNVEKFDKIPTDPLMDREYVYSVTHSKQEYEIAWIVEWDTIWLNSTLINESLAWDKVAKLKITWNYNGKFLKLSTWWVDYVLNIPSIITSTWGTLDYILANNGLAYNWYSNLPAQYDGSPYATMWETPEITLVDAATVIAYSGSFTTLAADTTAWETARTELITNAQTAYTSSPIATDYQIAEIVNVDLSDTWAVDFVASVVVNNDLWFDNIEIPVYTPAEWWWSGVSRFAWYDEAGTLTQIHMYVKDINGESTPVDTDISSNVINVWLFWWSSDIWLSTPDWVDYGDIEITSIWANKDIWDWNGTVFRELPLTDFTIVNWEYIGWVIRNTAGNEWVYLDGVYFNPDSYRVTFNITELTDNTWTPPVAMRDSPWDFWWPPPWP